MQALHWQLTRLRHHTQHRSLAIALGAGVRLWHLALNSSLPKPTVSNLHAIGTRFDAMLDEDLSNAKLGYYPKSLLFEFPLRQYLKLTPIGLRDAVRVWRRSQRNDYTDIPTPVIGDDYPDYYKRNFHWQTDGWFSEHSAQMYDPGVEFLFLGTADLMRRTVIPPIVDAASAIPTPKILDVACGTGRTLSQLQKAIPTAQYTGLDLSPYYLEFAKRNLTKPPVVTLDHGNGEKLPYANSSFDIVTSTFLFHELPKNARRNVIKELHRVLKPGGAIVLLDSAQISESPELAIFLNNFQALYHEPYFKGYLKDDLAQILMETGFENTTTTCHMVAKRVVANKPA